ncbi:helix-turn-helix domain-containing protein [Caldichromatium japonicum]|uniref:Helix-turn-helix domain-containing protein n=1 Tax=Caldichromatium japonicum TaxID=2699430 RepID=A0A6G7VBM8_9GAMM|nr:RodZ domain-containing protein [Caldichromatium japonicum]QIK37421.1 helix-turn-helix domain-containing protein [Caldichromatium japonicum]
MPVEDTARFETHETPGRQLRALREVRKLDIDRVAAQLHLHRQVVELIEGDQYDRLPAPVFVIGYIKNYARLLGVDPTPMIAAYRALVPPSEPTLIQPASEGRSTKHPDMSIYWVWAVVLLFAGFAAGGGVLWLRGQGNQSHAFSWQTAQQTSSAAAPQAPAAEQAAPVIPAPPETIPLRELTRTATTNPTPLTLPEPIPQAQVVTAVSPAPSPTVVPETDNEDEADVPAATLPAQHTAPQSPAQDSAGGSELVFEFTGTSWLDVRGADGKSILSGKMQAGDRRVVQGKPPYKIVVGNASVTQLKVGGQPYDLKANARGNVARFSLDPLQPTSTQSIGRP